VLTRYTRLHAGNVGSIGSESSPATIPSGLPSRSIQGRNPTMPKDGLRKLPDHVVAPLLRALMCIPRRPESRLSLRKVVPPRLHHNAEDYRVHNQDDVVGSIWLDPSPETLEA